MGRGDARDVGDGDDLRTHPFIVARVLRIGGGRRRDRATAPLKRICPSEFQPLQCGPVGGEMAATEGRAMTQLAPQGDPAPKRGKARVAADDVVTANGLATHLGMTRQNVARLTAEAVIEQRSDGCYDQTASRLRYIKHLRSEHRRRARTPAPSLRPLTPVAKTKVLREPRHCQITSGSWSSIR
jgi:hypothetical protein